MRYFNSGNTVCVKENREFVEDSECLFEVNPCASAGGCEHYKPNVHV